MLEPNHGLKDAPRALRKKLHHVLIQWLSFRQFYLEHDHCCVHKKGGWCRGNICRRASEHNGEHQETCKHSSTGPLAYVPGNL